MHGTPLRRPDLAKGYRKGKVAVPVLRGVDVEAERGELVAVIGASGSGKSTLLHVLGLLDAPDAGSVWLDGSRIDQGPDRQRDNLRNHTFGFIFQFYHLLPELTALENVMMPQLIRHGVVSYVSQRKAIRRDATALLERVGLGHRLTHYPSELSGGEMQRAAIAQGALVGRPGDRPGRRADRKPRRRDRPGGSGALARLEPGARAHYDDGHSRPADRPPGRPGRPPVGGADRGVGMATAPGVKTPRQRRGARSRNPG